MRYKVEYANQASDDMAVIKKYISEELKNASASKELLNKILAKTEILKEFPEAFPVADTKTDTEYRYLICDNYLIFYYIKKDIVIVSRVLYKKRDIAKFLV